MARSGEEWLALLQQAQAEVGRALEEAGFELYVGDMEARAVSLGIGYGDDGRCWIGGENITTWARPDDHRACSMVSIRLLRVNTSSRIRGIECWLPGTDVRFGAYSSATHAHGDDGLDLVGIVEAAISDAEAARLQEMSSIENAVLIDRTSRVVGVPHDVAVVKSGEIEVKVRVDPDELEGLLSYLKERGIVGDAPDGIA